ncbi:MAG: hypothetical protein ABI811_20895 [Acidobacteriota bacterium]
MRIVIFLLSSVAAYAQTVPPPITQAERLKWATVSTVGAPSLLGGAITSGFSTAINSPPEYGTHWEGYGKRNGLRLSGAAASNLMEAELGGLWGEDPRYRRIGTGPAKTRVWHAVKAGFTASNRKGNTMPAYARYIAIPVSNVISNTWRPDSQHTAGQVTTRISLGFISHISANVFAEFWPDIQTHVFHKK